MLSFLFVLPVVVFVVYCLSCLKGCLEEGEEGGFLGDEAGGPILVIIV